jgi:hypothetical protein
MNLDGNFLHLDGEYRPESDARLAFAWKRKL